LGELSLVPTGNQTPNTQLLTAV